MQFLVPQFIARETKLVGPLTFKALLYLVGEGIMIFALYFILSKTAFWIVVISALSLSAAFIFLRPGGQSLSSVFRHLGSFIISPKRYVWQKKTVMPNLKIVIQSSKPQISKKQKPKDILEVAPMSQLSRLETKIETKKIN